MWWKRKGGEELLQKNTRFLHSGRRDRLPKSLVKLIEQTEEKTKNCTNFTLHLAVDYGGKDEVLRAINTINEKERVSPPAVSEDLLRSHLDQPSLPDIDLILRSSGEHRTSNFFLFQTAYSEWIFSQKYFPDITTNDLEDAVNEYDKRKRRFGG
jgi:undecaprenyl diphosphate synthase